MAVSYISRSSWWSYEITALMSFAYCSTDLGAFLSRFQRIFVDMIWKILRGKSKAAWRMKNFFLKWMWDYILGAVTKLYWILHKGMQKDRFNKNGILEVGGMGARSTQWPEWRNSRDARTHLKMIGVGCWVIWDGLWDFWKRGNGRTDIRTNPLIEMRGRI